MHFRSMSLGIRAKLALRNIPTRSVGRILDAGRSCDSAVAVHNGDIIVYVILGRYGGRHFRHHYPPWQAIRRQAEITLELIDSMKFQIIYMYNMGNRWR